MLFRLRFIALFDFVAVNFAGISENFELQLASTCCDSYSTSFSSSNKVKTVNSICSNLKFENLRIFTNFVVSLFAYVFSCHRADSEVK